MLLKIEPLSQLDPRWVDTRLGTSYYTIGEYGCLLTCAVMMLRYYGYKTDPILLNDMLKKNYGFASGNLLVWGALTKIYPDVIFENHYSGYRLDKLDEILTSRKPAMLQVDFDRKTYFVEQHWILAIGKVDGSYIVNDPRDGAQIKFEDRYDDPRKNIYRISSYNCVNFPKPVPDSLPMFLNNLRFPWRQE